MRAESITQAEASMASQLRRWERMRDAIVAVMFSLTTLLGILGEPEVAGALPWMLGLSLLFMFWYGGVYTQIFRQHVADRLLRTTFYFVIGVALWLLLIALDGPYLMYLFILLTIAFPILPERWALVWSIGLTTVAIWRQAMLAGSWLDPMVLTYLFAGADRDRDWPFRAGHRTSEL